MCVCVFMCSPVSSPGFIAGILTESKDSRTVNTNTHNNYETVQVSYVIDSYIESDEC